MPKQTLTQALQTLLAPLAPASLGHNQVMIGMRPRYALLRLATLGISGRYEEVKGRIFSGDTEVLDFAIRLTEARYDDGSRPDLSEGGFFRDGTGEWYARAPIAAHVVEDLRDILNLHEVRSDGRVRYVPLGT
jgi:hypothetical protein